MKRKLLTCLGLILATVCVIGSRTQSSHASNHNPYYQDLTTCFSQHLISPEATVSARWEDYSFLNPPSECKNVMNEYVHSCAAKGVKTEDCSSKYAAIWIAINDKNSKISSNSADADDSGSSSTTLDQELKDGLKNPANNYAMSNNPFESEVTRCFTERVVLGQDRWNPDDGLKSAKRLSQDPACLNSSFAYFEWCRDSGAEVQFCGSSAVKIAENTIERTPYNLRMRETPQESGQIEGALANVLKVAETGDPFAETKVGLIYFESNGIRQSSPQKALPWFQKAAAQNNMIAETKLGIFYMYGMGVLRNPATAEKWWRKAAEQGSSEAASYLGSLYQDGDDGVPQNSAEALEWFKKAAAGGDEKAEKDLEKLNARLQKNPAFGSNIIFMDTKWGINESSDQDPACLQAFDHDPVRYAKPSRHSLDWCLVNMIRGGTPWSNKDACSTPLAHWCGDMLLGPVDGNMCNDAKKAEYQELAQVCKANTN